jgi:hypothetical protein
MCTVSFVARRNGYLLGMNRDEKLSRPKGLRPQRVLLDGRQVIFPSETSGGTWIALNNVGVSFALINWYAIKSENEKGALSRGGVIRAVAGQTSAGETEAVLRKLPLNRMQPFRLIGFFPAVREVIQWRWNLERLESVRHAWRTQQWISSGYDEPEAQRVRSKTFRAALRQKTSGRLDWLRRLHRSHEPQWGPFSTCMHRPDAATVSYTEIIVGAGRGAMRYCPTAPCQAGNSGSAVRSLKLKPF